MRILHVVTMLERGGAQWNTILSTEDALRRGHQAWMIASPGELSPEARLRLGDAYIELGSEIKCGDIPGWRGAPGRRRFAPLERAVNPCRDHFAYYDLINLMKAIEPDIVHTHSSKAGILGRWAAHRSTDAVIVHTAHGWGFHEGQNPAARAAYVSAERLTARITDRIVVVADANREKALAKGIGRLDQYVTIRSAIDPNADEDVARRSTTRSELGAGDDAFVVTWAGNFKAQKDPAAMARIVAECAARIPHAIFLVIGDGPLRGRVEHIVRKTFRKEFGDRIRLLGWRSDVPRLIAASDILLHTALFEGLPRVILEALARGVPVVSTNVDGIPEAVAGRSGVLLDPGDIAGFVRELTRLSRARETVRGMSASATEAFRPEFTLPCMFDRLDELYRELGTSAS